MKNLNAIPKGSIRTDRNKPPEYYKFDTKFEPSGTPNGSFSFAEAYGCQMVVNGTLLKYVK